MLLVVLQLLFVKLKQDSLGVFSALKRIKFWCSLPMLGNAVWQSRLSFDWELMTVGLLVSLGLVVLDQTLALQYFIFLKIEDLVCSEILLAEACKGS